MKTPKTIGTSGSLNVSPTRSLLIALIVGWLLWSLAAMMFVDLSAIDLHEDGRRLEKLVSDWPEKEQ